MASPSGRRPPEKALVVICSIGIGGAVEALPVFEMLREYWPSVHLGAGYFVEKQKPLLESCPYVSEPVRIFGSFNNPLKALRALIPNTQVMAGYQEICFLHKRPRVTWPLLLAARLSGAQVRYQRDYSYTDRRRTAYSDFPGRVLFQIIASNLLLGLPLTRLRESRISLGEPEQRFADEFFAKHRLGPKPVVLINTESQARSATPDWGIERYAQVANALLDRGADVLINGGMDHQVAEFRSVAHRLRNEVACLENPSPRELSAVISRCSLYLGSPTGPASIAMAVGTPTLVLVGPGEDGYPGQVRIGSVWWPRGSSHRILSRIDWCQWTGACTCAPKSVGPLKHLLKRGGLWKPLKKARKKIARSLGFWPPPAAPSEHPTYPCLLAITVDEVVEAAARQLGAVTESISNRQTADAWAGL